MKRSQGMALAALGGLLFGLTSAWADPITYSVTKPVSLYGTVDQQDSRITDVYGDCACGPTASVNSFAYLRSKYPTVFGDLIGDEDGDDDVDEDDEALTVVRLAGDEYMNLWKRAENYDDENENGRHDEGEDYDDRNGNGKWDDEEFQDNDGDGHRDLDEPFTDTNGNGVYDPGEPYTDTDGDGKRDSREPGVCDGVSDGDFVSGKRKWFDDHTSDDYDMGGEDDGGAGGLTNKIPDWKYIYEQLKQCKDVEIGFGWVGGGGHWVTATSFRFVDKDGDGRIDGDEPWVDENDNDQYDPGVDTFDDLDRDGHCDTKEECSIDFMDPWGGVYIEQSDVWIGADGYLRMHYLGGAAGAGGTGRIDIVVSEGIPEPISMAFMGCAFVGTIACRSRRRRKATSLRSQTA